MTLRAVTCAERPDLWERTDAVDRERDRAEYWEPNVWVRHRIP